MNGSSVFDCKRNVLGSFIQLYRSRRIGGMPLCNGGGSFLRLASFLFTALTRTPSKLVPICCETPKTVNALLPPPQSHIIIGSVIPPGEEVLTFLKIILVLVSPPVLLFFQGWNNKVEFPNILPWESPSTLAGIHLTRPLTAAGVSSHHFALFIIQHVGVIIIFREQSHWDAAVRRQVARVKRRITQMDTWGMSLWGLFFFLLLLFLFLELLHRQSAIHYCGCLQGSCHSSSRELMAGLEPPSPSTVHFEALSLEVPLSILSQHFFFVSLVTNPPHATHSISGC